mgnify:CR=1 FL=1
MTTLLAKHEPPPFVVERGDGSSEFFLTCDHASNRIPESLASLGLPGGELQRHIAWDIGAAEVARHLSKRLDATLVLQNYSRLVVDCNRPSGHEQLIPLVSEATEVPGNQDIDVQDRARRIDEIFTPYHRAITDHLDARQRRIARTVFVAIHSFTPVYRGAERPWHIGILYRKDHSLAVQMLHELNADESVCVGDNQPYQIDQKDYGIPVHGEDRGLTHVLIEIRQDLIVSESGQQAWGNRLHGLLTRALATSNST